MGQIECLLVWSPRKAFITTLYRSAQCNNMQSNECKWRALLCLMPNVSLTCLSLSLDPHFTLPLNVFVALNWDFFHRVNYQVFNWKLFRSSITFFAVNTVLKSASKHVTALLFYCSWQIINLLFETLRYMEKTAISIKK